MVLSWFVKKSILSPLKFFFLGKLFIFLIRYNVNIWILFTKLFHGISPAMYCATFLIARPVTKVKILYLSFSQVSWNQIDCSLCPYGYGCLVYIWGVEEFIHYSVWCYTSLGMQELAYVLKSTLTQKWWGYTKCFRGYMIIMLNYWF